MISHYINGYLEQQRRTGRKLACGHVVRYCYYTLDADPEILSLHTQYEHKHGLSLTRVSSETVTSAAVYHDEKEYVESVKHYNA
jgi:hypothetical protein